MKLKYGVSYALILFGLFLPMSTAQAHAVLVSSNPAIDANIQALPASVEVEFDGNLIAIGGTKTNFLTVQDSSGRQIDAGDSKVSGPLLNVSIKDRTGVGIFMVSWRVVSSDGHPVEGSYQFSVGNASVSPLPIAKAPVHAHKESFWIHHRSHIFLALALVVAIGIWAGYERARRQLE